MTWKAQSVVRFRASPGVHVRSKRLNELDDPSFDLFHRIVGTGNAERVARLDPIDQVELNRLRICARKRSGRMVKQLRSDDRLLQKPFGRLVDGVMDWVSSKIPAMLPGFAFRSFSVSKGISPKGGEPVTGVRAGTITA